MSATGSLAPTVTNEQRQAITEFGTPLPLIDTQTKRTYVLMDVEVTTEPDGGLSAFVPGIDAFGGGDTREEATLALAVILGNVLGPN